MAIYEYHCPGCGRKFELRRSMSQCSEPAPCPHCDEIAQRVLSQFACFSKDDGGTTSLAGAGSCSSCSAMSCSTCGM
ncbi:zinc ribbon domain-containing protein [Chloroflexota bacterium]